MAGVETMAGFRAGVQAGSLSDGRPTGLNVTVAGADSAQAALIATALSGTADMTVLRSANAKDVIDAVRRSSSNLVLLLAREADDSLLDTCRQVVMATQLPVIVFVETAPSSAAAHFVRQGASSVIVNGLAQDRLYAIIEAAMERHRLISALQSELLNSKNELTARKMIERAKGLLMQQQGLSEVEAYDAMRRLAMARGLKLADVAQTIIGLSDIGPGSKSTGG